MKLNNLIKTNEKKIRPGRGLVLEKEKPEEEVIKVRNQDLEWLSKALKEVKCHFIEDCQKEVLKALIRRI